MRLPQGVLTGVDWDPRIRRIRREEPVHSCNRLVLLRLCACHLDEKLGPSNALSHVSCFGASISACLHASVPAAPRTNEAMDRMPESLAAVCQDGDLTIKSGRLPNMPRLQPLPPEATPELQPHFDFFLTTLGFTPNSVLTMQRKPKLVQALAQMNAAAMDPEGEVDLGFRRLVGHMASQASGCLYCQAHTLLGAKNFGVSEEKLAALWEYQSSPLYDIKERLALDFALAAAAQPNAVTDAQFAQLQQHWSDSQIVEILGVVAMFGFLNRWNDTMGTPLEALPDDVARQAFGARGWSAGKHS